MNSVIEPKFYEELDQAIEVLQTAQNKREAEFSRACSNKDLTAAASLLANEVQAVKRLEQLKNKYADIADTCLRRSSRSVIPDGYEMAREFAELEQECELVLSDAKASEYGPRLEFLELQTELASDEELEQLLSTWSKRVDKIKNADLPHNSYRTYVEEAERICREALKSRAQTKT